MPLVSNSDQNHIQLNVVYLELVLSCITILCTIICLNFSSLLCLIYLNMLVDIIKYIKNCFNFFILHNSVAACAMVSHKEDSAYINPSIQSLNFKTLYYFELQSYATFELFVSFIMLCCKFYYCFELQSFA